MYIKVCIKIWVLREQPSPLQYHASCRPCLSVQPGTIGSALSSECGLWTRARSGTVLYCIVLSTLSCDEESRKWEINEERCNVPWRSVPSSLGHDRLAHSLSSSLLHYHLCWTLGIHVLRLMRWWYLAFVWGYWQSTPDGTGYLHSHLVWPETSEGICTHLTLGFIIALITYT